MPPNTERLCKTLGYQFKTPAYLQQALTHRSAGALNNERLEFLGDSILSFVIANALYQKFSFYDEGQLSRLRASLVKGDMLAIIASEIKLSDYLCLGQGELRSGGYRRASILSDALEAIFAAVWLDGGFNACQTLILKLYETRLNADNLIENIKDPKTELQEYLQSKKIQLPEYSLSDVSGKEHQQLFHATCKVNELNLMAKGKGGNRRYAEQDAAKKLLELIKSRLG